MTNESPVIRAHRCDDDARIVEIYSAQEPESEPLTVERLCEEYEGGEEEYWVAAHADGVVGYAGFSPAWWTGVPSIYSGEIRVDGGFQRQGIGTQLLRHLCSRLADHGATRLRGPIRADLPAAQRFAARHGFAETGIVVEEYRLHVPEANTAIYEGAAERLEQSGLHIASLAELDLDDEWFLRDLQALWADSNDEAADAEKLRESFPTWRQKVLLSPGLSPETHWAALEGNRPVGMTFLKRLTDDAAENDYTGVASTHRGRGIAPALKLRAIAWARGHGVDWFYTSSKVGNAPMIGINRRLGYESGPRRVEIALDLPE